MAAGWAAVVEPFWRSAAGMGLAQALQRRLADGATVFPPQPLRALMLTPLEQVCAVILGQDPYHGPGQAEGLAFSVAAGQRLPPSLRNIFKELLRDGLMAQIPASGSLQAWARRGVLLLNSCLTVEQGEPAIHAGLGWEALTDALIAAVAAQSPACVYLLWGAHAQTKRALIEATAARHGRDVLVLMANHPSPLSALRPPIPFIGCGHFGLSQKWLESHGRMLDWSLDEVEAQEI